MGLHTFSDTTNFMRTYTIVAQHIIDSKKIGLSE